MRSSISKGCAASRAVDRSDGALTAAVARHLALWMSYEDVIRVADLKTRPERFARVREEVGAKPDEPVHVTDIFKPGVDEVSALLPPGLGRRLRDWAERSGAHRRCSSRCGRKQHERHRLPAAVAPGAAAAVAAPQLPLRRGAGGDRRPGSRQSSGWRRARPDFAREIIECARLLKGYSDTHRHGRENYQRIFESLIRPRLERPMGAAAALRRAREAAFADPEGAALARELAAIAAAPAGPTSAAAE